MRDALCPDEDDGASVGNKVSVMLSFGASGVGRFENAHCSETSDNACPSMCTSTLPSTALERDVDEQSARVP